MGEGVAQGVVTSNLAGVPSGFGRSGSFCFALALLEVTRGGVF
jgi:hypothetical protein